MCACDLSEHFPHQFVIIFLLNQMNNIYDLPNFQAYRLCTQHAPGQNKKINYNNNANFACFSILCLNQRHGNESHLILKKEKNGVVPFHYKCLNLTYLSIC